MMAAATRSSRKRTKGSEEGGSSAAKRKKLVKWEWLGDGNTWTPYADDINDEIIEAFVGGNDELIVSVAKGVKMKIKLDHMVQTNTSTGWPRDIRCVPNDDSAPKLGQWEWQVGGAWKRCPEGVKRKLEAYRYCEMDDVNVRMNGKVYCVDMTREEMEEEGGAEKVKIRRIEPDEDDDDDDDDDENDGYIWQWNDDTGGWSNYLPSDSRAIESAYKAGTVNALMVLNGWSYNLDLMKMEQKNTSTKKVRKIRRMLQGSAPSTVSKSTPTKAKDVVKITMKVDDSGRVSKVVQRPPRSTEGTTKKKGANTSKVESITTSSKPAADDDDEPKVKPNADIKSQVFAGSAPVDSECTQKIGKARVFTEKNGDVWNCMLNQTNLKNNNNKFYLLQLLVDLHKPLYSVWFRWGRVGKVGQHQFSSFGTDLDSAKETFCKKFYEKTQNTWAARGSFVKVAGKYDMLEMDYEAKDECDEGDSDGDSDDVVKDKPVSKLDVKVQKLIEMICDVKSMEETIKEMKYDTKKAPLGKLTTAQIKSGFSALKKIESLVQAGNTRGDAIYKACDEFYTRIPHNFGMKRPPLITTKQEIKEKLALLEALSDIQVAMTILQKKVEDDDVHPIDRHYKEMDCEICPLSSDDEMYDLIGKYIKQTHGSTHSNYTLEVKEIFEINKQKEIARFKDVGNRQLLWHGSRITNWMGILSQGLRIAPPEAPVTGYMFGKGLYFADSSSKSANYCFATPNKPEGLLLLNEVSLGGTNDLAAADHNAHKLPKGTNSTKGVGQFAPDPAQNHTLVDGCVVPFGTLMDTGFRNKSGYTLNYNEYIIYDLSQTRMKYLIQLKFNFK